MKKIILILLISKISFCIFNNKDTDFQIDNNNGISQLPINSMTITPGTLNQIPSNAGNPGPMASLNNLQVDVKNSNTSNVLNGVNIQQSNVPKRGSNLQNMNPNNRVDRVQFQNSGGNLQTTQINVQPLNNLNVDLKDSSLKGPSVDTNIPSITPFNNNSSLNTTNLNNVNLNLSTSNNLNNINSDFISFGMNPDEEIKFQALFSNILNYGMLSMFTDLTDENSTINLMLVLKQVTQVAGKDIYKIIFKVDNPKYATGSVYYGAEFAIPSGFNNALANQVDFISFGKSVILRNVMKLLGIDDSFAENLKDLSFLNQTENSEGLNFSAQTKASMVQFIQTILSLTGNNIRNNGDGTIDNTLIGSANTKDDIDLFA